jgi:hypothetical protein
VKLNAFYRALQEAKKFPVLLHCGELLEEGFRTSRLIAARKVSFLESDLN